VAPRQVDYFLYKARHLVENLFKDLKNFRRMATRYDKLDVAYLSFVHLASVCLWLK
jgi:transposase